MREIGVQFSIIDAPLQIVTKTTMARRRKNPITSASSSNLFDNQRSHQMQYSAVWPIISSTSVSDFKEKFTRMADNNKSTKQSTTPTEFRLKIPSFDMTQTKTRTTSSNRSVITHMSKSSLNYPAIVTHPITSSRFNNHNYHHPQQQQQQDTRYLYIAKAPPANARRIASARISNPLPLHQQPHFLSSSLVPRPHPQYGHFLAYLRRQSFARMRRKQQHEEGNTDNTEATIAFNSNKPFQSLSNNSLGMVVPETASMPTITPVLKRKVRPLSSYRQLQRSLSSMTTNYRLSLTQSPPLRHPPPSSPTVQTPIKNIRDNQLPLLPPSSISITPKNSVVDETTLPSIKKTPYELQLSGDMLNYCYVSGSGVKYQGQLLSTAV